MNYVDLDGGYEISANKSGVNRGYFSFKSDSSIVESNSLKEVLTAFPNRDIDRHSMQMLLQCGVLPPGKTIYEDVYCKSPGVSFDVSKVNNDVEVDFKYEFPFPKSERLPDKAVPSYSNILESLYAAFEKNRVADKNTFLFHSAGKDSNSIALAIAEAGQQEGVTLVCQESEGAYDESKISKKIAKKLGFKHITLKENKGVLSRKVLTDYSRGLPSPVIDNVSLAFPYYIEQVPDMASSNIVDGGGNDIYMLTPNKKIEAVLAIFSSKIPFLSSFQKNISSASVLNKIFRSAPEQFGMSGLSFGDLTKITDASKSCSDYWSDRYGTNTNGLNFTDIKTDYLCSNVAASQHIAKMQYFCEAIDSNLILPFSDSGVADLFQELPCKDLYSRLRNKTVLRGMLLQYLDLDSDLVGKMPWTYDSYKVVRNNSKLISDEILKCHFWEPKISNFVASMSSNDSRYAAATLYRLFLVSLWLNSRAG